MKKVSEDDVGEGDLAVNGNQVTEAQGGRGNGEARRGPQEGLLPGSTGVATVGISFTGVAKSACFLAKNCSLGVSGVPSSLLPRVGSAWRSLLSTPNAHIPLLPHFPFLPYASVPHTWGP